MYIYDAMRSFSHVLIPIYQNPELIFHDTKKNGSKVKRLDGKGLENH